VRLLEKKIRINNAQGVSAMTMFYFFLGIWALTSFFVSLLKINIPAAGEENRRKAFSMKFQPSIDIHLCNRRNF
jgi:hypothetical protein